MSILWQIVGRSCANGRKQTSRKGSEEYEEYEEYEEFRRGPKGSERVRKSAQEVFGLGLRWSHPGLSRVSTTPGEPCLLCRPGATGLGDMGWFRVRWTGLNWFELVWMCWSRVDRCWSLFGLTRKSQPAFGFRFQACKSGHGLCRVRDS